MTGNPEFATLLVPLTRAHPVAQEVTLCAFAGLDAQGREAVEVEITAQAIYLRAPGGAARLRVDLRMLCDAAIKAGGLAPARVPT